MSQEESAVLDDLISAPKLSLDTSYRLIAQEDPSWFSEFVVATLTPSTSDAVSTTRTLDNPRLAELIQQFQLNEVPPLDPSELISIAEASSLTLELEHELDVKEQTQQIKPPEAPKAEMESSKGASLNPNTEADPDHKDAPSNPATVEQKQQAPVSKDKKPTILENAYEQMLSVLGAPSSPQTQPPVAETLGSSKPAVAGEEVMRDNATLAAETEQSLTQDVVASPDRTNESTPAETESPAQEDRVVVFRLRQSSNLRKAKFARVQDLGYSEKEVLALDPEALGLILTDRVRRPKRGVPPRWKRTPVDKQRDGNTDDDSIQIVTPLQAQELMDNGAQQKAQSTDRAVPKADGGSRQQQQPRDISSKETRDDAPLDPSGWRNGRSKAEFDQRKTSSVSVRDEDGSFVSKTNETDSAQDTMNSRSQPERAANGIEARRFVVYQSGDPTSQGYTKIPLQVLEGLGFNEKDVQSLQPYAVDLIFNERVVKPNSGVPPRWVAKSNEEAGMSVQIMDAEQAADFMQRQNPARDVANREESLSNGANMPPPKQSRRREPMPRNARRRQRSLLREDGQPKPIYTGRSSSIYYKGAETSRISRQRPDPPKPGGILFPDMDRFRSLLRQEAKFRLMIVGDDMSDLVKQECDWRLQLYKDWLWTLHDGIGNPLVESRSQRARRMGGFVDDGGSPRPSSSRRRRPLKPRTQKINNNNAQQRRGD